MAKDTIASLQARVRELEAVISAMRARASSEPDLYIAKNVDSGAIGCGEDVAEAYDNLLTFDDNTTFDQVDFYACRAVQVKQSIELQD